MIRKGNLFNRHWILALGALVVSEAAQSLHACGPWFPDSLLQIGYAALRPPIPSLDVELDLIELDVPLPGSLAISKDAPPRDPSRARRLSKRLGLESLSKLSSSDILTNKDGCRTELFDSDSELARDIAELATALKSKTSETNQIDRLAAETLLTDYLEIRKAMFGRSKDPALLQDISNRNWPAGLPGEFVDYLNGAADFREKKYDSARRHFESLLKRPLNERKYRSTLASYMLGRICLAEGDPELERSLPHFQHIFDLRKEGCHDTFGLEWDALQCLADYERKFGGRPDLGIRYYFALAKAGHPFAMRRLKKMISEANLEESAKDPFLRRLTTAILFGSPTRVVDWEPESASSGDLQKQWLDALERTDVSDDESTRLAWMAYLGGKFDEARRWLGRAESIDATGHWVQAKLDLQSGKTSSALKSLDKARPDFDIALHNDLKHPRSYGWNRLTYNELRNYRMSQYWGDQGLVRLANNDFVGALDAFVRSGYWYETAYVAEQLLSRDELLSWVLKNCPEDKYFTSNEDHDPSIHAKLRYLTARRLARDHYFKNAESLFPEPLLPVFLRYVDGYRVMRNPTRPESDRIQHGWETAQIHRSLGMELFGTELEPDWFSLGRGNFDGYSYTESRLAKSTKIRIDPDFRDHFRNPRWRSEYAGRDLPIGENWRGHVAQLEPTADERWRHRNYSRLPNAYRFHYRHVASDLAWETSQIMPGDDLETAKVLAIAGRWISVKSPKAADMFYKSLVKRNRSTALGHEANLRRWFPTVSWDYDPWKAAGATQPEALKQWW